MRAKNDWTILEQKSRETTVDEESDIEINKQQYAIFSLVMKSSGRERMAQVYLSVIKRAP